MVKGVLQHTQGESEPTEGVLTTDRRGSVEEGENLETNLALKDWDVWAAKNELQ